MKYFKVISPILLFLMMNCVAQNRLSNFDVIEYEAQTRGSFLLMKVVKENLVYKSNDKNETYNLSTKELNKLIEAVNEIDVEKIATLKAPSANSASDRALIGRFKIKLKGKEYISSSFDAGNPPKELKELESLLYSLIKLKE